MMVLCIFFFNDTATTEIYTLPLHDALPISGEGLVGEAPPGLGVGHARQRVHHGIEVGADAQAPRVEVVGGVDDHGEVAGRQDVLQARRELGPPDPARQGADLHARSPSDSPAAYPRRAS